MDIKKFYKFIYKVEEKNTVEVELRHHTFKIILVHERCHIFCKICKNCDYYVYPLYVYNKFMKVLKRLLNKEDYEHIIEDDSKIALIHEIIESEAFKIYENFKKELKSYISQYIKDDVNVIIEFHAEDLLDGHFYNAFTYITVIFYKKGTDIRLSLADVLKNKDDFIIFSNKIKQFTKAKFKRYTSEIISKTLNNINTYKLCEV